MMHVTSNRTAPAVATVSVGEKRPKLASCGEPPQPSDTPAQDSRKGSSAFIQRFYFFGSKPSSRQPPNEETCKHSTLEVELSISPKAKRPKLPPTIVSSGTVPSAPSSNDDYSPPVQCSSYSVQRLRQFWNNRVLSGATVDPLSRKLKCATIAGSTRKSASPQASLRFQRNGSIGRSGRRRSLLALEQDKGSGNGKRSSHAALLSPHRDPTLEKRKCVGSGGGGATTTTSAAGVVPAAGVGRDSFPLATSSPLGNHIHWARRTELLGIRALSREDKQQQQQADKMPLRVEQYVNNYIGVDIQSVPDDRTTRAQDPAASEQATAESREPVPTVVVDSVASPQEESLPPSSLLPAAAAPVTTTVATASLGRKCNTPTRKISFLNNISPYNRRLLAGNGTKVAALTSKFNQMIQQDASLLEQVKRRGGYLHKSGNVAYKVLEDTSGGAAGSSGVNELYGFVSTTSRNGSLGRSSLRKRNSNSGQQTNGASGSAAAAAAPSAGNHRTDESSDEISSVSSKNSSLRRTGVRKRPSLRKNIYRRPEWAESGHRNSSPGVRKMLEMFESAAAGRKPDGGDTGKPPPGKPKPKVPDKSEQVLQKTKTGPLVKEKKALAAKESQGSGRAPNIKEMIKEAMAEVSYESQVDGNVETTLPAVASVGSDEQQAIEVTKDEPPQTPPNASSVEHGAYTSTPYEATSALPNSEPAVAPSTKDEKKEKKKGKSTVSKIYERLTFRSSKKIQIEVMPAAGADNGNDPSVKVVLRELEDPARTSESKRTSFVSSLEIPTIMVEEEQPVMTSDGGPHPSPTDKRPVDTSEQKILEAISTVSQRIENLSKSFNDLSLTEDESADRETVSSATDETVRLLSEVRPNPSFLFRETGTGVSKAAPLSQRNLVEAVNTVVINKSVSMDDHQFPCFRGAIGRLSWNERTATQRAHHSEDSDYEPVTKPAYDRTVTSNGRGATLISPASAIDLSELTTKIESFVHKSKRESENLYQSISKPRASESSGVAELGSHLLKPDDTISVNSYESFENYESIEHHHTVRGTADGEAAREEDTYEICSPLPPDLPPARDDNGRTGNDLTLPQPKRILSSSPKTLPKHLQMTYQSNYERIKYSKIPPRPPKPDDIPLPPRNPTITSTPCTTPTNVLDRSIDALCSSISESPFSTPGPGTDLLDKSPHGQREQQIYEENIYDTIRSADDMLDYDDPASSAEASGVGVATDGELGIADAPLVNQQQQQQQHRHRMVTSQQQQRQQESPPGDTVSLVSSNCYESIGSRLDYVRNAAMKRAIAGGSTTTLASDQITNSLYGTTAGLPSLTPPSERGSDTSNSAEWTDISSDEEYVAGGGGDPGDEAVRSSDGTAAATTTTTMVSSKRPNFIVVRERKRIHHTPLRSRKVARIPHPKIDDDSDHHYESLYSIGSNERPFGRKGSDRSSSRTAGLLTGANAVTEPASFQQHRGEESTVPNDDEFDSFDSDDSEEGGDEEEEDERNRNRTDSGVDIRNAKLPDPPPSNSQVYVLVQKIKSLGTLSKSEIAKGFNKFSKKSKPGKGGGGGGAATGDTSGATYENAILPPKPAKPSQSKQSSTQQQSQSKSSFRLALPLGGTERAPKPPPEDYVNTAFPTTATTATTATVASCPPVNSNSVGPTLPSSLSVSSSLCSPNSSASAMAQSGSALLLLQPPPPPPSATSTGGGFRSTSESSNVSSSVPVDQATRKKSKSTKSLRSKLRKSLVSDSTSLNIGSSFNGSRSTFYVTSCGAADVDSGIFNGLDGSSGTLAPVSPGATVLPSSPSPSSDYRPSMVDDRRKSIAATAGGPTLRPTIPPPPPPSSAGDGNRRSTNAISTITSAKSARKLGATSWYAECGVFMQSNVVTATQRCPSLKDTDAAGGGPLAADHRGPVATGTSASSWYAEIYQTSGASVASSSESSGVSTGGEGGPGDDHSHSMFVNEPLYQIYNAAKLESITRDIDAEISGQTEAELYDDGYEKISDRGQADEDAGHVGGGSGGSSIYGDDRTLSDHAAFRKPSRPTALELIEPHVGKLRTLWCEIPEVRNSEILATLTPTEKRLQEAKFEILTSEASYLKSLNLLRTHFVNHPAFRDVRILSSSERKTLFSSIIPVQECSDRLLCDLENCWQDNIMLLGLSHSIYKHAEKHFHVYVSYCEHQAKIDRTLKALRANKAEFAKTLTVLESDPVCCSLSLSSFLMLPMQRITRMRLLLDAVLQRCRPDDDEFDSWEKTFVLINRILTRCNDAAHRSEQLYEMERLSRQIEFPTHIRPLPIVPCGIGAAPSSMHRSLEKRGELVHLLWRGDDAKLTFGKKFSKSNVYAFLFTDLLVLTKKKSDESYLVVDYCQRALLAVSSGNVVPGLPTKEMQALGKNLIIMTLLENHEGKTVEMILSCPTETERERWLMVAEPPSSENPDEKIYEQWDCPQVIAVHPYRALQPDELDLDIKDVVNVHRKMADGWYEGERIRDGAVGWFPSNYTKEIPSAHIRAKHIKQRHMLLTYTSKYIDTASKSQSQQHQQHQHYHHHHQQQHLQHHSHPLNVHHHGQSQGKK
ncbi:serine-rich adhesin for platelets [Anopheles aquasalis]|uniref:serine-rich adhesin for platelets n=1 Tax=Anopheles aquasalis TaxID=42839 RepID=UPI00215A39EC|nr:serine-rich adhesin for platelets [Anopheles aquasalis]XP_050093692.1 serine-rich adhesin for platelets [Anopheles aquasalis]XP_050093693.1 serine-rich adhesin for platelets [Anopheles aquasalis]